MEERLKNINQTNANNERTNYGEQYCHKLQSTEPRSGVACKQESDGRIPSRRSDATQNVCAQMYRGATDSTSVIARTRMCTKRFTPAYLFFTDCIEIAP